MKIASEAICFQEVPNEISLSLAISNCPYHCDGCHSQYLWNDVGRDALETLKKELYEKSDLITCVLFMGGDDANQKSDLLQCIRYIKDNYLNLKIALYSGQDTIDKELVNVLDYIKIGSYKKELGGLNHKTTNQKMYKIQNGQLIDITAQFWLKPYQLQ